VTPISGKELARLFESSGWNLLRVNGEFPASLHEIRRA